MATIQIQFLTLGNPPPLGYKIGYRVAGTTGPYTVLTNNVITSPAQISGLATGKYEGYLEVDCGPGSATGARTYWSTTTTTTGGSSSTTPTYSITPDKTSVNEGDTVTFTVVTTNLTSLTELYYNIVSSKITADDFTDGAMSGAFTITNGYGTVGGSGTFSKTLKQDALTEGVESFTAVVKTGSVSGNTVATSITVAVVDTSTLANANDPTYSITPTSSTVEEGSSATFNIATTNVGNGTVLYYTINPSALVTGADFGDGSLSGSVTIQNNAAVLTKAIALDGFLETGDSFTVSLRTGSITGSVKATSAPVSILNYDQSVNGPTYTIVPSVTTVNEGANITFTINTNNVIDGTILFYTLEGGSAVGADFSNTTLSGQVEINSNTGTIVRTITSDLTTEGNETFYLKLRTGSISGTVVKTSSLITIADTSTTPSVVTYYNVARCDNGATGILQYNGPNNLGNVVVMSNNGTCYTITGVSSSTTQSAGIFQTEYSDCNACTGYTPPAPTYNTLTINPTTVNEGGSITGTLTTSNVPDGTVLYFTLWTGSATVDDDFNQTFSGSFTVNGNSGTFTRTLVADLLTEGVETFKIDIRTGGPAGTIVKTSGTITVNDTSTTPLNSTYWNVNRCDGLGSGVIRDYNSGKGVTVGMIVMSTNGTAYIIISEQTGSTSYSSGDVDYEISTCP
jgi:plastocyanin